MIIDLNDGFPGHHVPMDFPPGHPNHNAHAYQSAASLSGETDYTIRKFIVTLGSGGIERDEVPAERDVRQRKEGGGPPRTDDIRLRSFAFPPNRWLMVRSPA